MAEFGYKNAKNLSIGHTPFELNCAYHLFVSFKEETNPHSQLPSADKISAELQDLMTVCQVNLHHILELQKQAYDRGVKPKNYTSGDKVWLNRKYIKTKRNRKLEAKFFKPFQVLYSVRK